jgi:uncharacterized protein (TIGR00251 family)
MSQSCCRWQGQRLLLEVKVQPRASRDELAGIQNGRLKVRLTAPPADGKANAALIGMFAQEFGVARSAVQIIKGLSGRTKTVSINAPGKLPEAIRDA